MSFLPAGRVNYRARIDRAKLLAERYTFAVEVLHFYAYVAQFQRALYEQLPQLYRQRIAPPAAGNFRVDLDTSPLLQPFGEFLLLVENQGPARLSKHSRDVRESGSAAWSGMLAGFWKTGLLEKHSSEPVTDFLPRAFLQPYAEFRTSALLPPPLHSTVCRCPRCNSLPVLGVLRQEGDGGKRFLQCSHCSQEWEFRRIFCASCGEEREQKLPVYVAEQFPAIRVECCETCKHCLRTIDLTRDGNAVPLVDDLAAVPLGLWAEENGYSRIESNLLGT